LVYREKLYQIMGNSFAITHSKNGAKNCASVSAVKHPQANSLVERANRSLEEGIKARLDERSKD
ncbi:reverse transcriptase domain-containing protein, partial [Tanacetum coccineum]